MAGLERDGAQVAEIRGADMDPDTLRAEIARILDEAREDPALAPAQARTLSEMRAGDVAVARRDGADGLESFGALALVFGGAIAREAGQALWREVIWPRLKQRYPGLVADPPPPST